MLLVDPGEKSMMKEFRELKMDYIAEKIKPSGDICIDNKICIERKTLLDYYGSVMNKGIFDEVARMTVFEVPIVAVVGNLARLKTSHPQQWNYMLSIKRELMLNYRVQVTEFPTDADLARFVLSCARHIREMGHFETSNVKRFITKKQYSPTVRMLMQIDQIGEETALKLEEFCGLHMLMEVIHDGDDLSSISFLDKTQRKNLVEAFRG